MVGEGVLEICADERILSEYDAVLRRPELRIEPENVDVVMELLRRVACLVVAVPSAAELPDADDLPFLEVAASADAILITGNRRHFPKKACKGLAVPPPGGVSGTAAAFVLTARMTFATHCQGPYGAPSMNGVTVRVTLRSSRCSPQLNSVEPTFCDASSRPPISSVRPCATTTTVAVSVRSITRPSRVVKRG